MALNHNADCMALHGGAIGFDVFVRRTSQKWTSLAYDLLARWPVPVVTMEDVRQELLIAVWAALPKWDAARGVTLERYLTWNACDKAKKWIHKMRGANLHGSADKAPSTYALPMSTLGEHAEFIVEAAANRFAAAPDHDSIIDLVRAAKRVLSSATTRERIAIEVFMTHLDREVAADSLFADPVTRLSCRLGSKVAAVGLVRSVVTKIREAAA